jgi:uncharacterized protein involved in type VI secretion and phage assembly
MRALLNAMRQQATQAMGERAMTRLGEIKSYDPGNYTVRVIIQPDGNLTGWIPLLSPWVGNGWGMFCPPTIGDLVEVQYQECDHDAPIACMRFFNDKNRPLSVPSGEFWLVHKSGSLLKFHNDGSIEVSAPAAISYTASQHNFHGPVTMDSTLTAASTITAPTVVGTTNVTFGGKSGVGHTHSGVQTGSGTTGAPS